MGFLPNIRVDHLRFGFYLKTNKTKFKKKTKIQSKPVQIDRFRFSSVILKQKPKPNRLVLVQFGFGSIRFDYFILKTKKYVVFGGFL